VTSGPHRFVRHPIYSGLLDGVLGTALVTNLIGLIIVGYFYYCASVGEKNLTATSRPDDKHPASSPSGGHFLSTAGTQGWVLGHLCVS
jgi:hypothetical protein